MQSLCPMVAGGVIILFLSGDKDFRKDIAFCLEATCRGQASFFVDTGGCGEAVLLLTLLFDLVVMASSEEAVLLAHQGLRSCSMQIRNKPRFRGELSFRSAWLACLFAVVR